MLALKLSEAKARAVGAKKKGIVVASDAFLLFQNRILEKPKDLQEAYSMLHGLSGSQYTFITGLAVYDSTTQQMQSTVDTCEIYFRQLSDSEIHHYMSRYPVLNFAGAHETDGVVRFSNKVLGNCNFVTAIPMTDLISFLRHFQVKV